MKIGLCCRPDLTELAFQAGFEYVELNFQTINNLPEDEFQALLQKLKKAPIPVAALNCMVPGSYPLCRENYDWDALSTYLRRGYERCSQLGAQLVVFGSGGARRRPDDMDPETATQALVRFLKSAAPLAAAYGITLGVEPLRPAECNILNSISEVEAFTALVQEPNVFPMVDQFHMYCGNDPYSAIHPGLTLAHAHIACPKGRVCPLPGDGFEESYRGFFEALKQCGYNGLVSVECSTDTFTKEELDSAMLKAMA